VSLGILDEYRRVLIELATHRPGVKYERSLELVGLHAEVVTAIAFARPVCTDPDDDIFLATALSAGAEYIVSGDKALLAQNGFRGLQVVSARAFLSQIQ
jgi:putative PIN family toxin of toxin-antitoxin system